MCASVDAAKQQQVPEPVEMEHLYTGVAKLHEQSQEARGKGWDRLYNPTLGIVTHGLSVRRAGPGWSDEANASDYEAANLPESLRLTVLDFAGQVRGVQPLPAARANVSAAQSEFYMSHRFFLPTVAALYALLGRVELRPDGRADESAMLRSFQVRDRVAALDLPRPLLPLRSTGWTSCRLWSLRAAVCRWSWSSRAWIRSRPSCGPQRRPVSWLWCVPPWRATVRSHPKSRRRRPPSRRGGPDWRWRT